MHTANAVRLEPANCKSCIRQQQRAPEKKTAATIELRECACVLGKRKHKMKKKRSNGKWFVNRSNQTGPPMWVAVAILMTIIKLVTSNAKYFCCCCCCWCYIINWTSQPPVRHSYSSFAHIFLARSFFLSLSLPLAFSLALLLSPFTMKSSPFKWIIIRPFIIQISALHFYHSTHTSSYSKFISKLFLIIQRRP